MTGNLPERAGWKVASRSRLGSRAGVGWRPDTLEAADTGPWGGKYRPIVALRRRVRRAMIPAAAFAQDIRKIIPQDHL
ncbi:hypothetical protein WS70_16280 [Burkholderia mayonis]|uniref:Uncharacterized protein n=1 Tax=Burkholderia mayonis TaxID=1385591 RepID=A0A1B4FHP5_9BURK|nr:hypothetical protein WS70_16280 [Burkholderia mayonis]KVE44551.1 hypothetical protein WS69_04320 [Burkholderia sp. BDU5]KVE45369.1 hypothetical protein WS70_04590 [Burkholderia mayonis]